MDHIAIWSVHIFNLIEAIENVQEALNKRVLWTDTWVLTLSDNKT